MSATVEAPPRGYCQSMATVASVCAGGLAGMLLAEARSRGGAGRQSFVMHFDGRGIPALQKLPVAVLSLLEDPGGWEVRLAPGVRAADGQGEPIASHVVFATWSLVVAFGARDGGPSRYSANPDDTARVAAALERFPLPASLVVDGGHEVAALWILDAPIHDLAQLRATQRALAIALDAAVDERPQPNGRPALAADDPGVFLPWGGIVRAMGGSPPAITWPVVEPSRVYALTNIQLALAGPSDAAPRKRGARS